MSALDEIVKLKAARRAELAAAEAERLRVEAEAEARAAAEFAAAVRRELTALGAAWLLDFCAGDEDFARNGRFRQIRFEVPGHRQLYLRLRRTAIDPDHWSICNGSEYLPWNAEDIYGRGDGYMTLADALIAAEIEGWVPPAAAPAVIEVRPEAAAKAVEAWPLMVHHAMPAGIAIDFVRDADCEREEAVQALLLEAVAWLGNQRPPADPSIGATAADLDAGQIAGAMLLRDWEQAEDRRKRLANWCVSWESVPPAASAEMTVFAREWFGWCQLARRSIEICHAIAEATP